MPTTLAILGGPPCFPEPRHVGTPTIPDRAALHARIDEILDTRRLSNDGPFVREFERRVAAATGARHAVAMCNATIAMQVLLRALGLEGEVVMPSFTFIATAHATAWEGLTPVFVDVDPDSHCIDPARAAAVIGPRTAAIVGVHLWGTCCDVDALAPIAADRGIPLVFDAAHAFGCTSRGRPIGEIGDASVLSFHATKVVHSLEGGAVITNDTKLADRLRLMRNFGFRGYDDIACLGTNAKLNEVSAAVGLGSLEQFPSIVELNRANLAHYRRALAHLPGFDFYAHEDREAQNWHYVIVRIDASACPLSRDELADALHAENILVRKYFSPGCHRAAPYGDHGMRCVHLGVTERLATEILALPTGTGVSPADIREITERIVSIVGQSDKVRVALEARRHASRRMAA